MSKMPHDDCTIYQQQCNQGWNSYKLKAMNTKMTKMKKTLSGLHWYHILLISVTSDIAIKSLSCWLGYYYYNLLYNLVFWYPLTWLFLRLRSKPLGLWTWEQGISIAVCRTRNLKDLLYQVFNMYSIEQLHLLIWKRKK